MRLNKHLGENLITGFAMSHARSGDNVKVLQKAFLISGDRQFQIYTESILRLFDLLHLKDKINRLLIHIKPDNSSVVYVDEFPEILNTKLKKSKNAGELIYKREILDISTLWFNDKDFDLKFEKGDKLVWLSRLDWNFGLFFDFVGNKSETELSIELGKIKKHMLFLELYKSISNSSSFNKLIDQGWFPFIQLIGEEYEKLGYCINDTEQFKISVSHLLDKFDKERILEMCEQWWSNESFNEKKEVIIAGVDAYFLSTKSGHINCIKTISTEIEGVMRKAYRKQSGEEPTTKKLIDFIFEKGNEKFIEEYSLGFPKLFLDYLSKSIFSKFDIKSGNVPSSRHSIAHGELESLGYTKQRAFQMILTLDQIYFYLGRT